MKGSSQVFIFICILFLVKVNAQLECENLSSDIVTYDDLQKCLTAQTYNETTKTDTLKTLNSIIDSYVFVDISRESPNPNIPMSVNIEDSLTHIASSNFSNDAEMQQAFAQAFIAFQDAHTRYTKPVIPYCHASFVLPIKIQSTVQSGKQIFLLQLASDELVSKYNSLYSAQLNNNIEGYQIISINGNDPLTEIGNFANTSVGYSKDYSARFNLAVDGYGSDFPAMYTTRNQSLQGIPQNSSIYITIQNPVSNSKTDLQLFWMGAYYRTQNTSSISNEFEILREKSKLGMHELDYLRHYSRILNAVVEIPPDVSYQMLDDGITAVLQITTFSPSNHTIFVNTILNAFLYFEEQNAKQLIIDLSQNGGGNICLGYALARYLFPDTTPVVGCYDMKGSDLFQLFASSGASSMQSNHSGIQFCGVNPNLVGYFTPCAWYDWYNNDVYSDDSWMNPGIQYTRGGVTDTYSTRITQGCQDAYSTWLPNPEPLFTSDKIILLSDGLCGSTCAVFSRHIQINHLAKTVVTGGVKGGQQPSFTSFPGGEVVDLNYVQQLAERYHVMENSLVPPPLPSTAAFRFAIREIYGWNDLTLSSAPQEFTYLPADFQIFYSENYLQHSAIWQQTIPYFGVCADWQTISCSVENGTGVYRCQNGSFNKTTCQVASCNPGHEEINGSCYACQPGFYKSDSSVDDCLPCYSIPPNCKYSSYASLSPMCDYVCSPCASSTPIPPPPVIDSGDIEMPIWLIIVISVGCFVLGITLGAVFASFVTRSYLQRKKHYYSHLDEQD